MADSSTEAMPSMTSPSPGNQLPCPRRRTRSPLRSSEAGTSSFGEPPSAQRCERWSPGASCAASPPAPCRALGHRLGEDGEQHGEPQPQGRRRREPQRRHARAGADEVAPQQPGRRQRAHRDPEQDRVPGDETGSSFRSCRRLPAMITASNSEIGLWALTDSTFSVRSQKVLHDRPSDSAGRNAACETRRRSR